MRLVIFLLISIACAVKRNEFKKCENSGFCTRNRSLARNHVLAKPEGIKYDIDYTIESKSVSIEKDSNTISFELRSVFATETNLVGTMEFYEKGVYRVQIKEKQSLFQRYQIPDEDSFMTSNLKAMVLNEQNIVKTEEKITFTESNLKVEINYTPFQILGYIDGDEVISINDRSLMNFEVYRKEGQSMMVNQTDEIDLAVPVEILDATATFQPADKDGVHKSLDNLWDERFGSHGDHHQRGPASVAIDVLFRGATQVYGIPEHADSFALKDTVESEPYRLYNLDVFEYELNERMALYGAVPYMLAKRAGFYWINASETYIDINTIPDGKTSHWMSETGNMNFAFYLAPNPIDLTRKFTLSTGLPPMPQQFALGYHQCRWNYNDQEDVATINANLDTHNIPCDVVWLDIEHTDSKKYFTWDFTNFPKPEEMQDDLARVGRKLVNIVDPHLKKESNYHVYATFRDADAFVKDKYSNPFEGNCWPGKSSYADFFRPEVRALWIDQFSYANYAHSTPNLYVWNDMNEPSVFSGPEITMPKDNLHGIFEHREVHNLYGKYMIMSTYEGLLTRGEMKDRPFVLTRSFYAGSQKYGAVWTGDNMAKWNHLEATVPMCLSLAVSGISFVGADVGGFFGDPEPELLVRWYQMGAFIPFYREHSHQQTKRREPWVNGEPYLTQIRNALHQRYKLLPYIYTLFHEYSKLGSPVIRPMLFEWPDNTELEKMEKQFMLGSALMVIPVFNSGQSYTYGYFPEGRWYDYNTLEEVSHKGSAFLTTVPEYIPVFIRGGHIVPRKDRLRRSTQMMKQDPYTIVVALDQEGKAAGQVYVDDGSSLDYLDDQYLLGGFAFEQGILSYNVRHQGKVLAGVEVERIVVLGMGSVKNITAFMGEKKWEIGFYKYENGAVIMKLPKVVVSKEWKIKLTQLSSST